MTTDGTTGTTGATGATGATGDGAQAGPAVGTPAGGGGASVGVPAANTVTPPATVTPATVTPANPALGAYAAMLGPAGPAIAAAFADKPLPFLVGAVLARLTDVGETFTAYDVTMVLRAIFGATRRALPHYDRQGLPGVQPEVHRQMAGYVRSGAYAERVGYPNGVDPARVYHPARRGRRGTGTGRAGTSSWFGSIGLLPAGAWVVKDGDGS